MYEEWKVVTGFPDYDISSEGKCRSRRTSYPKIMSGTKHAGGYTVYMLINPEGKKCLRLAHRLVAIEFLPPPKDGQTDVCHNDGNPSNNSKNNLRWDSHYNNQMDMDLHGTMQHGEKSCTAKLTAEDVKFIREQVAKGPRGTARKLALQYNMSPANISRIINGTRWRMTYDPTQCATSGNSEL